MKHLTRFEYELVRAQFTKPKNKVCVINIKYITFKIIKLLCTI